MVECRKRQQILMMLPDGAKVMINRCAAGEAPTFNQDVTEEVCGDCTFRAIIIKKDQERASRPIRFVDLHHILSNVPDTEPDAVWMSCSKRRKLEVRLCCNYSHAARVCDSESSSQYEQEVAPETCKGCPCRSPINAKATKTTETTQTGEGKG